MHRQLCLLLSQRATLLVVLLLVVAHALPQRPYLFMDQTRSNSDNLVRFVCSAGPDLRLRIRLACSAGQPSGSSLAGSCFENCQPTPSCMADAVCSSALCEMRYRPDRQGFDIGYTFLGPPHSIAGVYECQYQKLTQKLLVPWPTTSTSTTTTTTTTTSTTTTATTAPLTSSLTTATATVRTTTVPATAAAATIGTKTSTIYPAVTTKTMSTSTNHSQGSSSSATAEDDLKQSLLKTLSNPIVIIVLAAILVVSTVVILVLIIRLTRLSRAARENVSGSAQDRLGSSQKFDAYEGNYYVEHVLPPDQESTYADLTDIEAPQQPEASDDGEVSLSEEASVRQPLRFPPASRPCRALPDPLMEESV